MGLFSGISDAFNSVVDAIENAYDTFSEKVHDIFNTPSDYISKDVIVTPTKQIQYDEWLIEQNALDFAFQFEFSDLFDKYERVF
jgi:hypothetical protein